MARTTEAQIEGICEVSEGTDLAPFIEVANDLVTEICVPAGYSAVRLELIERWLAAHFYCVFDPRTQSESAGVSESYEGSAAMHLNRTRYGQQAMLLDTAGGLAKLNANANKGAVTRASISWLGVTPRARRAIIQEDAEEL